MPSHKSARILLVEDHSETLHITDRVLRSWGHDVVAVSSYAEALAKFPQQPFDILVADIQLSGEAKDGVDLVAALKEVKPIKAIAVTGLGSQSDKKRHLSAGFDVHITKPVSADALARAIAACQW